MNLTEENKGLRKRVAELERELDEVAQRARVEGERRFWRAAYEELLDKMVAKLS